MAKPLAPTPLTPAASATVDGPNDGVAFTWTFNAGQPGDTQSKYEIRVHNQTEDTWWYWDGTAWHEDSAEGVYQVSSAVNGVTIAAANWIQDWASNPTKYISLEVGE